MSQRVSGYVRQPDDAYETPPWVTCAIIPHLRGRCQHIWTPADDCRSKLARVLREAGFRVTATNADFLSMSLPSKGIDAICTNPPYGTGGRLAHRFIAHALELTPVVAMLLRVDFDSGKTRVGLFRDNPAFAAKLVLLDRITWFERAGAAGPSENHAWYMFHVEHRGPPTISYAGRRP
jgi:hypothetical protein